MDRRLKAGPDSDNLRKVVFHKRPDVPIALSNDPFVSSVGEQRLCQLSLPNQFDDHRQQPRFVRRASVFRAARSQRCSCSIRLPHSIKLTPCTTTGSAGARWLHVQALPGP